jgi:hypothetical protein
MYDKKKSNKRYFQMKIHAGVDKDSDVIESVVVNAANENGETAQQRSQC